MLCGMSDWEGNDECQRVQEDKHSYKYISISSVLPGQ